MKREREIRQARAMYEKGEKLKDIAKALGVPEGTVRRWKCVHEWDGERSQNSDERSKKQKKEKKEREVEVISTNPTLTEKQQNFCSYYVKCFNATRAYKRAYNCGLSTAQSNGHKLLQKAEIKEEIEKLRQNKLNREFLTADDIFQKYIDIAFADITDFVEFKNGFAMLKNSEEWDGTIITEVNGKTNTVRLADRMKALSWLADHAGLLTDEQKAKLEMMQAQTRKLSKEEATEEDGVVIINDAPG